MEIEKLSKFKSVIQAQNNRVSPDHVSYEELDDLRVNELKYISHKKGQKLKKVFPI